MQASGSQWRGLSKCSIWRHHCSVCAHDSATMFSCGSLVMVCACTATGKHVRISETEKSAGMLPAFVAVAVMHPALTSSNER